MPTHPGHPAIASTTLVSASRSLLNDAFDSVSLQTVTATATLNPDDGRYVLVAPASHATITLPDPASDERYQNVRLVLKRTTAGVYTATVVVAGGGLIDGASSTTLNAQYDCEVLFSDGTAWHRLRDQTNLLAPDYLDFGDWIVGTDDSNPAPVATSDAYTAPDGTTTADELEWDNTTELADESWAEPGASVLEAGDGAEYSFYIDSEVGDGIKTVLEVEDTSVPGLLEQTTVAFSNVFAEDHYIEQSIGQAVAGAASSVAVADPDGGSTALRHTGWTASTIEIQPSPAFSLDAGQEYTWTFYVLAETDSRTHSPLLRITGGSGTTNSVACRFRLSTGSGVSIVTFSSSSAGPAYTSSNAFRSEQVDGTDWWKISMRIADYGGDLAFLRPFHYFYQSLNAQNSFASWKWELRYGDHVSSQQLLTVDDGVENLLPVDLDDFPTQTNLTLTQSAIAAPDGTLTAWDCTSAASGGNTLGWISYALNYNTTKTAVWYVYQPSIPAAFPYYNMNLLEAGGAQITVRLTPSGSISYFVGVNTGPTLTTERNVSVEAVGNSGWLRLTATMEHYPGTSGWFQVVPIAGIPTSSTVTLWSPALRYGDWVARGKNKADSSLTNLLAYPSGSQAPSVSTHIAPDGTSTAVDLWASSGGYYPLRTLMPSSEYVTGGRYTAEFYIKHPLPSRADAVNYGVRLELVVSAGTSDIIRPVISRSGGITSIGSGYPSAGPGYTLDDTESLQITDDGWWRYRVSVQHFDTANPITAANFVWLLYDDTDEPVTIWNPRLTVGNPADARGYFVSGPQNLLGDGSDYSSWSTGTAPQDVTVTTNQLVAPNGRLEADDITHTQGDNTYHYDTAASVLSGGETVHYVWYYKVDGTLAAGAGETVQFSIKNSGGTVIEQINWAVAYDDATPTVALGSTTTAGSGYTTDALEYVAVSNDWVRCQITLTDFGSTGQDVEVYHYGLDGATSAGATYDVSLWGSEVTTLDRTPTANELRPVSNGVVDFDAYPPEHRSLFADLEDAGDNWYKVTTKITDI